MRKDKDGVIKLQRIANKLADVAESGESWAVKEVADRIDGKPVQSTEISGKDGGAIQVDSLTTADRARALAAFVAKTKVETK